jgi:hypothetical protein
MAEPDIDEIKIPDTELVAEFEIVSIGLLEIDQHSCAIIKFEATIPLDDNRLANAFSGTVRVKGFWPTSEEDFHKLGKQHVIEALQKLVKTLEN